MPQTSRYTLLKLTTLLVGVVWISSIVDWWTLAAAPAWLRLLASVWLAGLAVLWWRQTAPTAYRSRAVVLTWSWWPGWAAGVLGADLLGWSELRGGLAQFGLLVGYLIGLAWLVYALEQVAQLYERRRKILQPVQATITPDSSLPVGRTVRNPLDPAAWFYGRHNRRLNQSLAALCLYSLAYTLLVSLISQLNGCTEIYEMPAGGGQEKMVAQTVKIQKVVKKKFIINPYSSIKFTPPPIEEVALQLDQITAHQYAAGAVGFGEGDGAGFGGGTFNGKVRFIRIEYSGGDWDQDFGVGADLNMLTEYGVRTKHKIHSETEARTISQLRNFALGKSPPFVYMTGQKSISLSQNEYKILREYLLDKHGMIFCDNGGSRHFHNQFVQMMGEVLEHKVEPVAVPLDDPIHRQPYALPFLPYVAPHGGKEALGWKVDGRWVCYYSPGDIADAWSDGHAGVKPEIWEYCYQMGTNVIFYAHMEYSKWLQAREKK